MQLNHQFLNIQPPRPAHYNFDGDLEDSEKFYKKNYIKLGNTWEYYNKKVSYVLNDRGFRTKPFNDISWENSIVMFGCSNVFGTGLIEEDTVAFQLEKKLSIPVINLGISGSAVDLAAINSLILHEHYPKPLAIVHLWTAGNRYSDFNSFETNNIVSYHPSLATYNANFNWEERSKFYILADRVLWKNQLPYYEASWFEGSSIRYGIEFLETLDHARDLRHPGSISTYNAAEKIAAGLKAQGL